MQGCGLTHPGSGFPQGRERVDLLQLEASCELELRSLLKLLLGYNHHKAANEHQRPVLSVLQATPPTGSLTLVSDWKELVSLPISPNASGEQFYATARMECSVWGACMVESVPGKDVLTSYYLVISDILDHTCLRTNQLVGMMLERRKSKSPLTSISLISDPGPHYRGYEALYYYAATLVQKYDTEVNIHYGCEKHSKSICDRLFGWFESYIARAKENQQEILSIESLADVIRHGNATQRERDPSAPQITTILDQASRVPNMSKRLVPAKVHITRTYCLSAVPDRRVKPTPLKIRLFNHVFSSKPVSVEIDDYTIEDVVLPAAWRKGFWGSGKSGWDTQPEALGIHDHTGLSRRYDAQKHLLPEGKTRKHGGLPSLDEELAKHERRLQRRRDRSEAKKAAFAKKLATSSSSSSDSSDSSSS